jgi:serine protease Do
VALASGTVLAEEGLIVTLTTCNAGGRFNVTWEDGQSAPARLVVDDRRSGLQLLKVDSSSPRPFLTVASESIVPGDPVAAVVAVDMHQRVAAQGIVTGTNRQVGNVPIEAIQTDLRVGAMSAGAPLVNQNGGLVGIIAAVQADAQDVGGPTFALPSRYVQEMLDARRGEDLVLIHRGFFGVRLEANDDAARVAQPLEDSPAANAGILAGDVILAINDQPVRTSRDVQNLVARCRAGERIRVKLRRGDAEQTLELTLGRHEAEFAAVTAPAAPTVNSLIYRQYPEQLYFLNVQDPNNSHPLLLSLSSQGATLLSQQGTPQPEPTPPTPQDALARWLHVQSQQPSVARLLVEQGPVEQRLQDIERRLTDLAAQVNKLEELCKALESKLDTADGQR